MEGLVGFVHFSVCQAMSSLWLPAVIQSRGGRRKDTLGLPILNSDNPFAKKQNKKRTTKVLRKGSFRSAFYIMIVVLFN